VAHFELRMPATAGTASIRLKFAGDDAHSLVVPGVAAMVSAAMTAAFAFGWRPHLVDPGARGSIETAITNAAATSAALLLIQYRRRHHLYPLLLLGGVGAVALTELVFAALPALFGPRDAPTDAGAAIACNALVPLSFALAGLGSSRITRGRRAWRVLAAGGGCIAVAAGAELAGLLVGGRGIAPAGSTAVITIDIAGALVFLIAGVAFLRRGPALSAGASVMAAASFLLAASRLQAIAIPVVATGWVTPRELLRLAAYGLVVAAVLRDHVRIARAGEEAALTAQREEIARDLHDGLAQDLAVIAFHGQRLEAELGAGHPVTLAARRALAASRQRIVDLSASHASSTTAALCEVAEELEATFGIEVSVHDEVDRSAGLQTDLRSRTREQFVRIAREAIVNAARHGEARHVDVTLASHGPGWLLTIADDGSGIAPAQVASPSGFGLRAIRARADELGGRFSARPGVAGGTVLELSLADSPDGAARSHRHQL
jgi:signal transduction histidine kinase